MEALDLIAGVEQQQQHRQQPRTAVAVIQSPRLTSACPGDNVSNPLKPLCSSITAVLV